jgi:hypothetical protein
VKVMRNFGGVYWEYTRGEDCIGCLGRLVIELWERILRGITVWEFSGCIGLSMV